MTQEAFKKMLANLRPMMKNRNSWLQFASSRIRVAEEWGRKMLAGNSLKDHYSSTVGDANRRTAEIVFDSTESPIERLFLCALFTHFLEYFPAAFRCEKPMEDAIAFMDWYQEGHTMAQGLWEEFRSKNGDNWDDLKRLIEAAEKRGAIPKSSSSWMYTQVLSIASGFTNSYFLIPQAGMPSIEIDGRSIRVDLLFWRAGENFKLVVECDGYAYHKEKDQFERDRKRVRQLRYLGFDVHSYSGTEICRDPVAVAGELFSYLISKHPPTKEVR